MTFVRLKSDYGSKRLLTERNNCPEGRLGLFLTQCGRLPDPVIAANPSLEYFQYPGDAFDVFRREFCDLLKGIDTQLVEFFLYSRANSADQSEVVTGLSGGRGEAGTRFFGLFSHFNRLFGRFLLHLDHQAGLPLAFSGQFCP